MLIFLRLFAVSTSGRALPVTDSADEGAGGKAGAKLLLFTGWALKSKVTLQYAFIGPPGVLESWGEFRELRSTGNYFQGFGEQANSFGDLGSLSKK